MHPTDKALRLAADLQHQVMASEWDSSTATGSRDVKLAIVHTRQDIVQIYSMLVSIHRSITNYGRALVVLFVVLIAATILS